MATMKRVATMKLGPNINVTSDNKKGMKMDKNVTRIVKVNGPSLTRTGVANYSKVNASVATRQTMAANTPSSKRSAGQLTVPAGKGKKMV